MDETTWGKILSEIRPVSISIEGLLRNSKPLDFDGKKLKIEVSYKFHKDKLEETKNKKLLEDCMEKIFQNRVVVECLVISQPTKVGLTNSPNENIMTVAEEMFS
ncbi:MAG: hypothetical protein QY322_04775 [bacterium]|nr:MAG: hypothetical protein QY322_04775 [bacterium]